MEIRPLTILAVDDNQDNLISLKALIYESFPEARVLTALNGKTALELADADDPDLILLDVIMPEMDGFDVCRKLKDDEKLRDIPVVFVTALKGDKESRIRGLECGAEAFLAKPVDESELTAQIRAMVKIKNANLEKRDEKIRLARLVEEQTSQLLQTHSDTLNLLEELKNEIETRKQIEETMRASEEKYSILLKNLSSGVVVHSPDSMIIFSNPMASTLLGLTRDQMKGKAAMDPAWRFLREDGTTLPQEEYPFKLVLSSGRPIADQVLGICRSDTSEPVWVQCNSAPVLGADGNLQQVIVSFSDITERKQAAEEKLRLEGQLQQAQKMESVGRLAGGVAHDFNNMLSVILGHAELGLMRLDPSHPVCADLQEISKTAQRSADLTRQLLAFARKQTIAPKVIDLNETVAGMLKMLQRLIGEDIELIWQPSTDLWQVKMDPSQLDQSLANLCVNARDAIENTGRITIETENSSIDAEYCAANPEATPGNYVRLTVSDDGSGMDRETLLHIFEPFYTTKEQGKGTGLGLATVYGIVKQNKGFISIYSEPGQGTTFSVYLPRDAGERGTLAATGDQAAAVPHGRETILLVEDEPAILNIALLMLEKQGYTVLAASTPGEAIRMAREYPGNIQMLMTDVIMPEMNGRDLAKNILSLYPRVKRLFMSGYTADVIAHHGVLDEGVHFIQKPFSLPTMAAKVRMVLDSR